MVVERFTLSKALRIARRAPFRWAAAPTWAALIDAELAMHRARDRTAAPMRASLDDVTVMIKTFERPAILARLLRSIRRLYPGLRVIVVDDSRRPVVLDGVDTVVLPYDSGVSAGRNAGLARVETPFFVLADDDFVFFRKTRLGPTLERMRAHPELDIVGGTVVDLPFYRTISMRGRRVPGAVDEKPAPGTIAGLERRELIANFFVGRTERVRLVGWENALKRVDHADFFGRARGVLTVVEDPGLEVLHARTPFDRAYMQKRNDVALDLALLRVRWDTKRAR